MLFLLLFLLSFSCRLFSSHHPLHRISLPSLSPASFLSPFLPSFLSPLLPYLLLFSSLQHMLRECRRIRPDFWIFAELFTGSQALDLHFERCLGINALVREAMQTHNAGDLAYHLKKFGMQHGLGELSPVYSSFHCSKTGGGLGLLGSLTATACQQKKKKKNPSTKPVEKKDAHLSGAGLLPHELIDEYKQKGKASFSFQSLPSSPSVGQDSFANKVKVKREDAHTQNGGDTDYEPTDVDTYISSVFVCVSIGTTYMTYTGLRPCFRSASISVLMVTRLTSFRCDLGYLVYASLFSCLSGRQQIAGIAVIYGPRTTALVATNTQAGGQITPGTALDLELRNGKFVCMQKPLISPHAKIFAPANLRAAQDLDAYKTMIDHWMTKRFTLRYTGKLKGIHGQG